MVEYFIGIVPPVECRKRIRHFRERWHSARHVVTEPHITVKAQGGLTEDLAWVRHVCSAIDPFAVTLEEPRGFGETVVYLNVYAPGLMTVHKRLVETMSLSVETLQHYFEGDLYVPHLTLGQSAWGMTQGELREMYRQARVELASLGTFTAFGLQIFRGLEPGGYVPTLYVPFGS